jgi:hypothetical protein
VRAGPGSLGKSDKFLPVRPPKCSTRGSGAVLLPYRVREARCFVRVPKERAGGRSRTESLINTGGHDCAQAIIATLRASFQALFVMVATASRCARVVRGEIMGWWGPQDDYAVAGCCRANRCGNGNSDGVACGRAGAGRCTAVRGLFSVFSAERSDADGSIRPSGRSALWIIPRPPYPRRPTRPSLQLSSLQRCHVTRGEVAERHG